MLLINQSILYLFQIIQFLIFARVVLSWVARGHRNQIIDIIYQLTEPILEPFRRLQYKLGIGGMLDFSPIMALLTMQLLVRIILGIL